MIEINLHSSGGQKKSRKKRRSTSLPSSARLQSLREDPWNAALIAVLVIVPLIVLSLWLMQRSRDHSLQQQLDAATADSSRLAELRVLSDSLLDRRAAVQKRIDLVEQLDGNRFVWPHLLDEIGRAVPDLAWLTAIKRESSLPNVQVQLLGTAANPLVITQFVHNLEQSPYLTNVQIVSTQAQKIKGLTAQAFTLTVNYRSPPSDSVPTAPLLKGGA
jgi:type IV pilus assembly protein PilN